ncbi:MAG: YdiY family protein [Myxococcota bacterium]
MWIMLLSLFSFGQDDALSTTVKEPAEVEKPESSMSAQIGGALASGNTSAYNASLGINASHKWTKNKLSTSAGALFGQSVADADGDGILSEAERDSGYVTNQQQATWDGRYDRFLGEKNSLYFLAGVLVDPFAGFASRSHEQIGYSRTFIKTDETNLVGEIGFDWAQENYVAGTDPGYNDVFAARLMVGFKHVFNEAVSFENTAEVYPNVLVIEDVRVLNTASLGAKLSDKLGFKTGYNLRFDNQPVEGFRKADHALTASLVISIL